MHPNRLCVVLLLALTFAFAGEGLFAQGSASFFPVGVVDLARLVDEHPKTQPRMRKLREDYRAKVEAWRERGREQKAIYESLDVLTEGSREFLDQVQKLRILKETQELRLKYMGLEYDLAIAGEVRSIYGDVVREVEAISKKRKLKMIHVITTGEIAGTTKSEVESQILLRSVLYYAPELDLTDEVLAALKG